MTRLVTILACALAGCSQFGAPSTQHVERTASVAALAESDRALLLELEAEATSRQDAEWNTFLESVSLIEPTGSDLEVVTSVRVLPAPDHGEWNRQGVISRYQYDTGLTIETTIDLETMEVLRVEPRFNDPTPLTEEEVGRAREIAGGHSAELKEALGGEEAPHPDYLLLIESDRESPRFGHRLVRLLLGGDVAVDDVTIDLTTAEVVD